MSFLWWWHSLYMIYMNIYSNCLHKHPNFMGMSWNSTCWCFACHEIQSARLRKLRVAMLATPTRCRMKKRGDGKLVGLMKVHPDIIIIYPDISRWVTDDWLMFPDKNRGFLEDVHGLAGFLLLFDLLDQSVEIRIATPETIEKSTPIQL